MTPEQIKKKVQDTYVGALRNRSVQWQRGSGIDHLFRNVRLFGEEAGVDFVETYLDSVVQEAIEAAGCKQASVTITLSGFGRAAVEGMAQALRRLTDLRVETGNAALTLRWAETSPALV